MGAGSTCALVPIAFAGGCVDETQFETGRRFYGASAVAWSDAANHDPDLWRRAVQEMYSNGLRRVTLVSYAFVNSETGEVTDKSFNNLDNPPSLSVLRAGAEEAASLGMEVCVRPWVEVDNDIGAGEIWRGFLSLDGAARDQFTNSYGRYLRELAKFAKDIGAERFYIGSELGNLTSKPEYSSFWRELIDVCRQILRGQKCLIGYAANFDEYEDVTFWGDLDEIGIDAYVPLATYMQSRGSGNPSNDTAIANFQNFMQRLEVYSNRFNKPIFICEWGIVPFDTSASDPSNELPSTVVDRDEAVRMYKVVLSVLAQQGSWLTGVDFWHWSVDPHEDSNYRIEPNSDIGVVIKSAIKAGV